MRKSFFLSAIAALMATAATADVTWDGFYAGANLTHGKADLAATGAAAAELANLGFGPDLAEADGITAALRVGFDYQHEKLVFGVGADVDLGMNDADLSPALIEVINGSGAAVKTESRREAAVFGRAGITEGKLLAYGLAGWTWVEGKGTATDGTLAASETIKADGLTIGLGAEYRISNTISGYGEFTYTDYSNIDFEAEQVVELNSRKIKLGLNYRF